MVVHRRKKVTKYRAHNTHGHGASKKHRGAGSRGGKGNAGTGKRAGQKKAGMKGFHMGQPKGFTRRRGLIRGAVFNLGNLNSKTIAKYVQEGSAVKEGDKYIVNLSKFGYGKLLGTGSTDLKLKIIVNVFSTQAEEKVKAAGGEIVSE